MSALEDLIQKISDEDLRRRIQKEVANLKKTKKFGLVFEPQNPEFTPLYNVPVKKNSLVALKAKKISETYRVVDIDGHKIFCVRGDKVFQFDLNEVVSVAQFGDSIYPCLQKIDEVCNAPDSDLWHALIEADNYHALQLLKYLYAGKVDCIYIDPPYNTGARDWKYNNEFVDAADSYRHSKWLSMMQKRLELAKEILSDSGAIFISIDDNEQATLKLLCDEIFGWQNYQATITYVRKTSGKQDSTNFAKSTEYILVYSKNSSWRCNEIIAEEKVTSRYNKISADGRKYRETDLRKTGTNDRREDRPNMFYPFYYDEKEKILSLEKIPNSIEIFPIKTDGTEGRWRWQKETAAKNIDRLVARIMPKYKSEKKYTVYEKDFMEKRGEILTVKEHTFWNRTEFNSDNAAQEFKNIGFGNKVFSFPKSMALIKHIIYLATNKNSLIVDFFAGSGTTLHAVNLLNAEDGGKRRCILVTNNEVSDAEEKNFRKQGLTPADDEWQKYGIARYVTWTRTVCTIEGHDINGVPLKGNYFGSEIPMADGFKSNVAYFKLGFLDKNFVELGRQFKEILPVIWFKAGCRGKCPPLADEKILPPMLILPENNFAVLIDEMYFGEFWRKVHDAAAIDTLFFVTNSEYGYHQMIRDFPDKTTYQLYKNYLENFKISG